MPTQAALRSASRRAFMWPEEAAELVRQGRSLSELVDLGPYIEKLIHRWLDKPPRISEPPELRRQFLTVPQARAALAKKPSWMQAVRGDLQLHTTWSDGDASISEMAESAANRRYEYIALTDHTKGLKIAGGIDEHQVREQAEEIAEVNDRFRSRALTVLRSVELNINVRGEGDMDSQCLGELDLVLGCFHSSLRSKEEQTPRYVAALRNPHLHILGHPRGRVYNYRLGLSADWPRVFGTAAELDKAVEIDGYPDRQDLNLDLVRLAAKAGCRISLGTDSHGAAQLRFMEYSAAAALMAGVKRDKILNFMPRIELLDWVATLPSVGSAPLEYWPLTERLRLPRGTRDEGLEFAVGARAHAHRNRDCMVQPKPHTHGQSRRERRREYSQYHPNRIAPHRQCTTAGLLCLWCGLAAGRRVDVEKPSE